MTYLIEEEIINKYEKPSKQTLKSLILTLQNIPYILYSNNYISDNNTFCVRFSDYVDVFKEVYNAVSIQELLSCIRTNTNFMAFSDNDLLKEFKNLIITRLYKEFFNNLVKRGVIKEEKASAVSVEQDLYNVVKYKDIIDLSYTSIVDQTNPMFKVKSENIKGIAIPVLIRRNAVLQYSTDTIITSPKTLVEIIKILTKDFSVIPKTSYSIYNCPICGQRKQDILHLSLCKKIGVDKYYVKKM